MSTYAISSFGVAGFRSGFSRQLKSEEVSKGHVCCRIAGGLKRRYPRELLWIYYLSYPILFPSDFFMPSFSIRTGLFSLFKMGECSANCQAISMFKASPLFWPRSDVGKIRLQILYHSF